MLNRKKKNASCKRQEVLLNEKLIKTHKDFEETDTKLRASQILVVELEKVAKDYRIQALGKERVISEKLKEKLRAHHAKEANRKEKERKGILAPYLLVPSIALCSFLIFLAAA